MNFPTQSWFMTPSLGYIKKVLTPKPSIGYDPSSLIGFWPQDEKSGLVSLDHSGLGHHGVYTGVTLGQPGVPGMGLTCPFFDGANDYNNIASAGSIADFSGVAGTILFPMKMYSATEWTDGLWHHGIHIYDDGQNNIRIVKHINDNRLAYYYEAGNVLEFVFKEGVTSLDWMWTAITWDKNAGVDGEVKCYFNGVQEGATRTALGVWVGPPIIMNIGAFDLVPQQAFKGWIGPVLLYNEAKPQPEIAYLSTP